MKKKFKFLEHTADLKLIIYGKKIEEVFENSVRALSFYLAEGKKVKKKIKKSIKIQTEDLNSLLYSFIEEILFLLDSKGFLVSSGKISLVGNKLSAILFGDDVKYYSIRQIKAPTYSEMKIEKKKNEWQVQLVLDI